MQNVHFSETADPVLFSGIDAAIQAALTPVQVGGDPLFVRCMPSADDIAFDAARSKVCGELTPIDRGSIVRARDGREYVMLGYGGQMRSPSGALLCCDVVPVEGAHWHTHVMTFSDGSRSAGRVPLWDRAVRVRRTDVVPTGRSVRLVTTYRGAQFPAWLPDAA